eukprot:12568029-Ditylum_brightwellii.AAC.1
MIACSPCHHVATHAAHGNILVADIGLETWECSEVTPSQLLKPTFLLHLLLPPLVFQFIGLSCSSLQTLCRRDVWCSSQCKLEGRRFSKDLSKTSKLGADLDVPDK